VTSYSLKGLESGKGILYMKIFNLTTESKMYTSNVFLILGEWNAIDDVNTLIDVGSDELTLKKIEETNTGLGKKKVDQVIITHSHSDHTAILPKIIDMYSPTVSAFNSNLKGINRILNDGDKIKIGEKMFEVFHITAHSYDSICLFCESDGVLFAGDTTFPIEFENNVMEKENEKVLARLCKKNIKKVYYGHGSVQDYTNKKFHLTKKSSVEFIDCGKDADF
jgi:glyoxylase-like metal-dependent hydrolase (beta-lactamase superfamily II)